MTNASISLATGLSGYRFKLILKTCQPDQCTISHKFEVRLYISEHRQSVKFATMDLTTHSVIWLGMAQDARTVAARLDDPDLRRQMLILAEKYEVLARNAKASVLRAAAANCNEPPRVASN